MFLLDNDLYKFTTSYAYMKLFPDAECTFTFNDRNHTPRTKDFLKCFEILISNLSCAIITKSQIAWCIENIPYIPNWYWEWLESFRFDPEKIRFRLDHNNELSINVTDKAYKCTLYEVPLLYCVTEAQSLVDGKTITADDINSRLMPKIKLANENGIKFSEFGTRRRYNYNVQNTVINTIKNHAKTCTGTSNVYFAYDYGMKPMGTHPHEWFMFHGAQYGYKQANYIALENWVKVYDGDLGIALSDTFTTEVFLNNFSMKHAKLFDGVRQDSGSEYRFVDKVIERYKEFDINPLTKTIIFSNALDFPKALEIQKYCAGKINCSFGIGTNLTNDIGATPENIVMKMSRCRINRKKDWNNCVKISDDLGKEQGNPDEINLAYMQLKLFDTICQQD